MATQLVSGNKTVRSSLIRNELRPLTFSEVTCKIGESYAVALQQRGLKIDLEKLENREHTTFYC